jgi:hypothetical protein
MDRPDLDRVLEAAGAQFEAAVAAEEDAAANDLALSLAQGSELSVLLCRSPWTLRRPGGGTAPVKRIGPDAAMAASVQAGPPDLLVPLAAALFVAGEGSPPERTVDTFLSMLRRRVRTGGRIKVVIGDEAMEGRPKLVTETHVVLIRPHGEAVIPVSELREVQLLG